MVLANLLIGLWLTYGYGPSPSLVDSCWMSGTVSTTEVQIAATEGACYFKILFSLDYDGTLTLTSPQLTAIMVLDQDKDPAPLGYFFGWKSALWRGKTIPVRVGPTGSI